MIFAGQRDDLRRIAEETVAASAAYDMAPRTSVVGPADVAEVPASPGLGPEVTLVDATTLDAARAIRDRGETPAILVFASARHPGGGFLGGMMAQEEDIAYRSTLYASLTSRPEYYAESERRLNSSLYFDKAVYTRGLVVLRDSGYAWAEPWECHAVTAPAPNRGAALAKGVGEDRIDAAMANRVDLVLRTFAARGDRDIVLGAFGCGVFRNLPERVAEAFRRALFDHGLAGYFAAVTFAIPGAASANWRGFEAVFGGG